jgi:hypothetical protein
MKKMAMAIILMLSCTDEDAARGTLEAQGFSDIEILGYGWSKCAESDSTCTTFKARGPTGVLVRGAVGCGRGCGKGCTVRITYTSHVRDH